MPDLGFVFVDDGSTDETNTMVRALESRNRAACHVVVNAANLGKAEAVRRGVLFARQYNPIYIGYWDADLATPLEEISTFVELLREKPELQLVMGARVKLLGRSIRRRELRHYLGRAFATCTSLALDLGVYDTQCGAKLFRNSDLLAALFSEPFLARWIFDVEILARLIAYHHRTGLSDPHSVIYELPLVRWHDVSGSKVTALAGLKAAVDLVRICWRYQYRSNGRCRSEHLESSR